MTAKIYLSLMKSGLICFVAFVLLLPGQLRAQAYPVITLDNAAQIRLVAELPMPRPGALAWSPDGSTLAVDSGGDLRLYSLADLEKPPTEVVGGFVRLAYRPDGTLLGLRSDASTIFDLVDVQSGETLAVLDTRSEYVISPVFNIEGTLLALGDEQYGIQVWDLVSGTLIGTLVGHEVTPYSVAFSADSRWLASGAGTGDHRVFLWDLATLSPLRVLSPIQPDIDVPAEVVAFSPDGRWLVAGTEQGQPLVRWDLEKSAGAEPEVLIDGLGAVFHVAFSPDSRLLAVQYHYPGAAPNAAVVRLLDTATNTTLNEWGKFPYGLALLSYSADGTLLATVGYDRGIIQLWGIPN